MRKRPVLLLLQGLTKILRDPRTGYCWHIRSYTASSRGYFFFKLKNQGQIRCRHINLP